MPIKNNDSAQQPCYNNSHLSIPFVPESSPKKQKIANRKTIMPQSNTAFYRRRLCIALSCLITLCTAITASASALAPYRRPTTERPPTGRPTTQSQANISFVLLTNTKTPMLQLQQWLQVLRRQNVSIRTRHEKMILEKFPTGRTKLLPEKPTISQSTLGTKTTITITARIDRSGNILLQNRSYSIRNTQSLITWINSIKKSGIAQKKNAQALTATQQKSIATALTTTLTANVANQPLKTAIKKMNAVSRCQIRFSTQADKWLRQNFPKQPNIQQSITGYSLGTTLAIVLREYGLGFRPTQSTKGSPTLTIEPISQTKGTWPVGRKSKANQKQLAPKLFNRVPRVILDKAKITDVWKAFTKKTDIPIYIDHASLAAKKIKLDQLTVSYLKQNVAWYQILTKTTVSNRLTDRLLVDESGKPFIWITTSR